MVGHTPAPWGVSEDGCWIQPNSGSSPMVEGRYLSICVSATSDEDKRLIIASPDLLIRGKHLAVKLAEVYREFGVNPQECQAIREFMDAVKKAEGK